MRRVGLLALGVVPGDLPATDKPTDAGQVYITACCYGRCWTRPARA